MTPVEVLRQARDLWLAHPTTGSLARNKYGDMVSPLAPEATCWCAMGAIGKYDRQHGTIVFSPAFAALRDALLVPVPDANDAGTLTREHWDTAIRSLGGEP